MRIVIQIDTGDETPTVITDTGAATIPPWPTDGAPADLTASSETALAGGTGGPYRQQPVQPSTAASPGLLAKAYAAGGVDGGSAPSSPLPDDAPHPFTTEAPTATILGSDLFTSERPIELAVDVSGGPAPDMDGAVTEKTDYVTTWTASDTAVQAPSDNPQQAENESASVEKKPDRKRNK
ncbi:hypothetical protein ASG92_25455 [Arthrobacter sp. Soil736]|uniref:hypothetical protein n=1 Tax=Arthrobacter sp. Soil736 TaxID=1736395 RepID=UPI000701D7E2|nr:hypothetical protein [Arthrobacter sp. Soil736]KRE52398.1 hypothetical protein ASG92_25455 [Arthrobacter sp. Soil736]